MAIDFQIWVIMHTNFTIALVPFQMNFICLPMFYVSIFLLLYDSVIEPYFGNDRS